MLLPTRGQSQHPPFLTCEDTLVYAVSPFLTWHEVNVLASTCTRMSKCMKRSRQVRVAAWRSTACEGEQQWIDDYQRHGKWWRSSAHKWMRCLRYRHVVPEKFEAYVGNDKRLCSTWRVTLLRVFRKWTTASVLQRTMFYWYVFDVLSHTLVPWPLSMDALRKLLSLVPSMICGQRYRVVGRKDGVRVFSNSSLVGFVDTQNRLWRTVLWDAEVEAALKFCCERPLVNYCSYCRNHCIGCGVIEQDACQSSTCALRYAALSGQLHKGTPVTTIERTSICSN